MQKKKLTRKEKVPGAAPAVQPARTASSKSAFWLPLSVVLLALAGYCLTLGYGYVLDDYSAILENKSTQKGISALAEFFTTSYRYGYVFAVDELYRPLTKAVFGLQWSLSPNNPFIGHLMNLLVYGASVLLIFRLVRVWTNGKDLLAWLTALLFAVMPIHTEVVANIKSIDELLGLFFCLLALLAAHTYTVSGNMRAAIATAIWFLLALFSKESSVTVLAIFPLAAWYFTDEKGMRRWMPMILSLLSLLLFLALRAKALGPAGLAYKPSYVDNMLVSVDFIKRECTAIFLLGRYLFVLLAGFPLSFDNSWPQLPYMTITSPLFIVSAVVLLGLFGLALRGIGKKDILSFGLLYFFVTVSLVSNIFLLIGTQWGERLMYLPGLGIALAVAALVTRLNERMTATGQQQRNMVISGVAFAVIFGGMTLARIPVWKSNETIYLSGLESAPNSTRVHYYLGNFYQKEDYLSGKDSLTRDSILQVSEKYLRKSLSLSPTFIDAWNQLGLIYYRKKQYTEAMHIYDQAFATGQADATIYNNAGTVYFSAGMPDKAIAAFNTAVRMNPHYSEAWSNLGSSYGQTGQFDQAIGFFERALKEDPRNKQAMYFLGITWRNKGNEALAQQYLNQAEALR